MDIVRFPRIRLGHFPTPLEPMDNLTRLLGGPRLWIKRDDCTGLSTGGNKTRKLEFLLAEAQALRADVVITQGATQSNHARQTAAAAARLGLQCHVLLEDRTGNTEFDYTDNGNVLLDRLHGCTAARRHVLGQDDLMLVACPALHKDLSRLAEGGCVPMLCFPPDRFFGQTVRAAALPELAHGYSRLLRSAGGRDRRQPAAQLGVAAW